MPPAYPGLDFEWPSLNSRCDLCENVWRFFRPPLGHRVLSFDLWPALALAVTVGLTTFLIPPTTHPHIFQTMDAGVDSETSEDEL